MWIRIVVIVENINIELLELQPAAEYFRRSERHPSCDVWYIRKTEKFRSGFRWRVDTKHIVSELRFL